MTKLTTVQKLSTFLLLFSIQTAAADPWDTLGNAGTDPSLNFLGTTDSQPLVMRTNGNEVVRINSLGNVGIGTNDPIASLDIRASDPNGGTSMFLYSGEQVNVALYSQNKEPVLGFGNHDHQGSSSIFLDRGDTPSLHFCVAPQTNCQFPSQVRLTVTPSGKVGIGTRTPQSDLQVKGYIQADLTTGQPPATDCNDASQRGRMKVDSAAGLLYVCVDSGWIAK